jgi:mannose-6-phosphate isomerase
MIGKAPFSLGAANEPRVLVCIDGAGQIDHGKIPYPISKGDVWLLPAEAGVCPFRPGGEVTLLEIAIPS